MKIRLSLLVMCCLLGIQANSQQVLGNFSAAETFEWPRVVWYQDIANNWDEGLIKTAPNTNGILRSGFGIHLHQSRQFSFWSTGLDPLLSIEGGSGKTYIKGNVGIGTKTPFTRLHIQGGDESITLGDYDSRNSVKGIYFPGFRDILPNYFGASIESVPDWICCGYFPAANGYPGIRNMGLNFNVHGDVGVADSKLTAMAINSNGNIGIGTLMPKEKLSVNGKIRAHEIKVETASWPDYVFDQDYKVLGLQELDAYIKANKHLPEMPSAKEVEANGIALGETNKLLLKKVEELTLHLIDQNKKIITQNDGMHKQDEKIAALESLLKTLIKNH